MNLNSIIAQLGVPVQFTQDLILVIFLALASFVYGMLLGRHKLMSILVNIYVAFSVVSVAPKEIIGNYSLKVGAFLVLLVVLTLLSRRFFDVTFSGFGSNNLWKIFTVSFLEIGMMLSIILSMLPKKDVLVYISANAYGYLVGGLAPLFWMAAPLIFMLIFYKGRRY